MADINVLIIPPIGNECLQQIAEVSPRIRIMDASGLWDDPVILSEEYEGDYFGEAFDSILAEAEVFYGYKTPLNVIARAPKLKWI